MSNFLKYLLLFLAPIIISGISLEIVLRQIPNDYKFKKEFLDNNSNTIRVLVLGSSHTFYGINPAFFSAKSFNASFVSQSLDLDYEILRKYNNKWSNLQYIVLPISYFSLFSVRLEGGEESWRVKNYNIYYKIFKSNSLTDNTELLGNKFYTNLSRVFSYFIMGNSKITSSNLGWGIDYNSKIKKDLNSAGKNAAKRHTFKNDKYFKSNINVLKSIIEFARNKGVKILMFTPPAYHTYIENLDIAQLNKTISTAIKICDEYDNVEYINLISDKSFAAVDFYDADHLNEIGAKKLSFEIDSLINRRIQRQLVIK